MSEPPQLHKMYYVYILKSKKTGRYYTGYTSGFKEFSLKILIDLFNTNYHYLVTKFNFVTRIFEKPYFSNNLPYI